MDGNTIIGVIALIAGFVILVPYLFKFLLIVLGIFLIIFGLNRINLNHHSKNFFFLNFEKFRRR